MLYSLAKLIRTRRWQRRVRSPSLRKLYQSSLPSARQKILDTQFIVIDCEMTGLNAQQDHLLSVGWVEIAKGQIDLSRAFYSMINTTRSLHETEHIHGLQKVHLRQARNLDEVLSALIEQLHNKIAVFHHAPLDLGFLHKQTQRLYGAPLLCAYLDTLAIEQRSLHIRGRQAPLQLDEVRKRFNLPPAPQHYALADALATAELLLAQCAHLGDIDKLRLADLGIRCS